MADLKIAYAASANQTVTALNSMAYSATWTVGWSSGTIDNTSNLYVDSIITGKFTAISTPASTAGQIRVYLYAEMDDSTWPDIFSAGTEGTVGAATLHSAFTRDNLLLAQVLNTTTTVSEVYCLRPISVASMFGGTLPRKYAMFITHSMVQNLESTGNQITTKGVYYTLA